MRLKEMKMKDINNNDWEYAGIAAVDSGMILIADPCYWLDDDQPGTRGKYRQICDELGDNRAVALKFEEGFTKNRPGKGVAVSSGHGDGLYPVYICRDERGIIKECKIVFLKGEK